MSLTSLICSFTYQNMGTALRSWLHWRFGEMTALRAHQRARVALSFGTDSGICSCTGSKGRVGKAVTGNIFPSALSQGLLTL